MGTTTTGPACSICGTLMAASEENCPQCGFAAALGEHALGLAATPSVPRRRGAARSSARKAPPPLEEEPPADVVIGERTMVLRSEVAALRTLGGTPPAEPETVLRSALRSELRFDIPGALAALEEGSKALNAALRELLDPRVRAIEREREQFEGTSLATASERLPQIRDAVTRGDWAAAVALLTDEETEIARLRSAQARPSRPAAMPAGPTAGLPPARMNSILERARSLQVLVRSLPPESPLAARATAQIREATELLRLRKVDEAEATLARLMDDLLAAGENEAEAAP
jgi:hypothetical protein